MWVVGSRLIREKMQQPAIDALFGRPVPAPPVEDGRIEVFDFFCGAGGFSTGARAAGCKIAFACDNWDKALDTHKRNHPETIHRLATLPIDDIPFPTDGRRFHVHGSPPCQKYSKCNHGTASVKDVEEAGNMVEWFIDMAFSSGAQTWSMEEVASTKLLKLLEAKRRENSHRMAFEVFKCEEFGIPQRRKRVIAGSPHLIAKLKRLRNKYPPMSVRQAVAHPRGTHIRDSTSHVKVIKKDNPQAGEAKNDYVKAQLGDSCFPIDGPSPTITTHSIAWVTKEEGRDAHKRLPLLPHEGAALQTFPADYKWPTGRAKTAANHQIGNAMPPFLAELLMRPENDHAPPLPHVTQTRAVSPSLVLYPK